MHADGSPQKFSHYDALKSGLLDQAGDFFRRMKLTNRIG
jgi:hypothetical protein